MQADAYSNVTYAHTGAHSRYGRASNIIMKLRTRQKILRSIESLELRANNNFYQKKKEQIRFGSIVRNHKFPWL